MVTRQSNLQGCSETVIAMDEHQRLACDLHDGLLHSLTGIALQLETVQYLLAHQDLDAAYERLQTIQILLMREQRWLRGYIERLRKPHEMPDHDTLRWNSDLLLVLGDKIEQEWGLAVTMAIHGPAPDLPAPLTEELYLLVQEALMNSARHANAAQVQVEMTVEPDRVRIQVQDNGRGFIFRGRYDLAELAMQGWGPRSLIERITALRGQLILESDRTGARLDISVPR